MGPTQTDAVLPTVIYPSDEHPSLLDHVFHIMNLVLLHVKWHKWKYDALYVGDDMTLDQLLGADKRDEPDKPYAQGHEPQHKRARLDTCSTPSNKSLKNTRGTMKAIMEIPGRILIGHKSSTCAKQQQEEQAIQLQGITKNSRFKHTNGWGILKTGEWERCLVNLNIVFWRSKKT